MLVINRSGYNFGFKHNGTQYTIPFDNKPHQIPDDSPGFQELQILVLPPLKHLLPIPLIATNVNNPIEQKINCNISKFQIYNNSDLEVSKLDPKALFIYHNLGLGDHIICNGFVRKLAENYNHVYLFCKPHNYESVNFIYKDLYKLEVLKANDKLATDIMNLNKFEFRIMGVKGDWSWDWEDINSIPPDDEPNMIHSFAKQVKLDVNARWDNYYVDRDNYREHVLFKELELKPNNYIFVHEDKSRNCNINYNLIKSKLRVVTNSIVTTNIFDYCKILENAKEIHCMDSSFRILCEHLNVTDKLYYHQYVKNSNSWGTPISKKNWKIFT